MRRIFSSKKQGEQSATGWIGNLGLFLGSVIVGLLFIEIGLRFFAPQPMSGTVFEYAPRGYSVSKSKGTALFSIGESKGLYHFVSPHLRGLRPPPVGAERILALGDSFTFGLGLPEEDTYVARIQQKIDLRFGTDRIALLNAGIGGSGTAEHLAFLEDFGDKIAPRVVLVFVSIDDFNRAERSPLYRLRSATTLELDEANAPVSGLKTIVTDSDIYNFAIQHIHVIQLIRNAVIEIVFRSNSAPKSNTIRAEKNSTSTSIRTNESSSTNPTSPDQQRLVRALFRRMKAWCDSRGVKLAVINNGWQPYDWLPELLASENITAFDAAPQVQPAIARNPASYVIPRVGHPNAAGAKLIADAVWPFIYSFINESGLAKRSGH